MLTNSASIVVARNETWTGNAASEPYEAAWAREAVIFMRVLSTPIGHIPNARVEISPDGMNWVGEGTTLSVPRSEEEVTFARVTNFGNWLRIAAEVPKGSSMKVLVTVALKG